MLPTSFFLVGAAGFRVFFAFLGVRSIIPEKSLSLTVLLVPEVLSLALCSVGSFESKSPVASCPALSECQTVRTSFFHKRFNSPDPQV